MRHRSTPCPSYLWFSSLVESRGADSIVLEVPDHPITLTVSNPKSAADVCKCRSLL